MKKTYESIELVKVSPDVLSRVQFDTNIGNMHEGMVNLNGTPKNRKLLVTAPVTHAARLTNNNGLYQPRRMVQDISSFVAPYMKPVLTEHSTDNPPIGRVVQATYEPIDHSFLDDAPELLDEADTFKLIKFLMKTGLIYKDDFPGVGQGILSMEITDKDAIEKFLDQRYLTFSIRVASNKILDPHTGLPFKDPFAEDDEEEEIKYSPYFPGESVDGLPGFIVLDLLKYKEVSPVSVPADELAIVRDIQEIVFADSENKFNRTSPSETDGSCQIQLITQIGDVNNMNVNDNQEPKPTEGSSTKNNETVNIFEHITDASSADEIYDAMALILVEDEEEDAKLTPEQRKALSGSAFCGPNRSFPAPDSAHVTAAKSLIERAKLSESQKERVLTCINRKAKQLGCNPSDSEDSLNMELFLDNIKKLSDFDFSPVLDSILDNCKERGIDSMESEGLAELIDNAKETTSNKLIESKIQELEAEKKLLEEQIDSLTGDLKNFASISNVLLKVFKDNLKIQSLEDAIVEEKNTELDLLKKSAEELLKDAKLIDKVRDYIDGFLTNENLADNANSVEDPTQSSENATTEVKDSWLEKQIRTQFETIKLENGISAALQYLKTMSDSKYISKDFAQEISIAEIEQDNN